MDQAVKSIIDAFGYVLPEVVLVATACVLFLLAPFFRSDDPRRRAGRGIASACCRCWGSRSPRGCGWTARRSSRRVGSGPARSAAINWRGSSAALTLSIGVVLVLLSWNQFAPDEVGESQACLLLILAGVNLTVAANDLVGLFLALELVSIPTYVLLYLIRSSSAGQEAVVKYFLLSIFSSALLLYGFSFLYGAAGTTNLEAIRVGLVNAAAAPPMILAIALMAVLAGVGFRVTAVPFHFYAPDVFQGTHAAAAAMLSIVPKLAGFVVLLRLVAILPAASGVAAAGRRVVAGPDAGPVVAGGDHDELWEHAGLVANQRAAAAGVFQHCSRRLHARRLDRRPVRAAAWRAGSSRCCFIWRCTPS